MEKKNRRGLPCPGRPKKIKGSGLVSGRSGRRRLPLAALTAARFAPRPRKGLRLRPGEQNLHTDSAPPPATGGLFSGAICSPLPAKPCGTVPGSKIFTEIPRRRLPPAAFFAARFAPRSSQSLAAPPQGAKSSQKFRAAACHRPAFQRRDLLPTLRKALRLRSGEQNLRRNSAPAPASGGLVSGAICSPLPAKPCGTVPGSKIFTEIPRRRLPPATFTAARFAPRSPQRLAASYRGAKSSHRFRAAACLRRLFQRRDLLPAPRKALRLRSGEQNLHSVSAPPLASGVFFSGAMCSPPPAKACGSVPGSKIFTSIPRRRLPPAAFSS